jgi:two-component system response regulator RegA
MGCGGDWWGVTEQVKGVEQHRIIRSVLVIDDDPRVLAALARSFGVQRKVFTATSSEEAARVARREKPDLAVVDMRLGAISGIDVVRMLKTELPSTTFAIISGYLTIDSTVAAVHAGADIVVTKPIRGSEILRRAEHGEHDTIPDDEVDTPTLAEAEAEHIARVMTDCKGNISEAARRLGIYRSSLQRKLRKQQAKSSTTS